MKPPIWERQGRPKPPRLGTFGNALYAVDHRRWQVVRGAGESGWTVWPSRGGIAKYFPTFADAIAYADREARR